jgi:integrase
MLPATVEPLPFPQPTTDVTAAGLLDGFDRHLTVTGRGGLIYQEAAEAFMARWPDPHLWSLLPLEQRLAGSSPQRQFIKFLMMHRHLQPGWDWLVSMKLTRFWRNLVDTPIQTDMEKFTAGALQVGYTPTCAHKIGSQSAGRLLIQTGRPLDELTVSDLDAFRQACAERTQATGKNTGHYRVAIKSTHNILFHLGIIDTAATRTTTPLSLPERFTDTHPALQDCFVNYLNRKSGTCRPKTITTIATRLSQFGRFLANLDPPPTSLAELDRVRHIEPFLNSVANATNTMTGQPITVADQARRIRAVSMFLTEITEWGWENAPTRRLIFSNDIPRLERPLPRYIPVDQDRRLAQALAQSPARLAADALLLARATGLRIGELRDLQLDCVHDIPNQGSWLKVPLGKLDSERMVPLDPDTVELIDQIIATRSTGRPLPEPCTGKPVQFLFTNHGHRLSTNAIRAELERSAKTAGIDHVTPHQLRHTYATALVNAGVSLQALMALLGHVSAQMSLRYAHLFDSTVRAEYERALAQAKTSIGVMPTTDVNSKQLPRAEPACSGQDTQWQDLPAIKTRLGNGYCVRAPTQGACTYANICEHCPSFHTNPTSIPMLTTQRADTEKLITDAQQRGWTTEVERHQGLLTRLDALLAQAAG